MSDGLFTSEGPQQTVSSGMPASHHRIPWGTLALETFSIVLGVLLALGVNEWREQRATDARVAVALHSIHAELSWNRDFLQHRLQYYARMAQTLDSLETAHPEIPLSSMNVQGWRGLSPPVLRASSYDAAIATEALVEMDFEIANAIAQVYHVQAFYMKAVDKFLDIFVARQAADTGRMRSIFNEMTTMGNEVLQAYENVLPILAPEKE